VKTRRKVARLFRSQSHPFNRQQKSFRGFPSKLESVERRRKKYNDSIVEDLKQKLTFKKFTALRLFTIQPALVTAAMDGKEHDLVYLLYFML